MDKNKPEFEEDSLKSKIEKLQAELPNLVLPTMGIVDREDKIDIDGKEYIKHKVVKED